MAKEACIQLLAADSPSQLPAPKSSVHHQVCCAWDVYMTMGADPSIQPQPTIPTVFVTMRDGDLIHQTMAASSGGNNQQLAVRAFMRPRPAMNWSSILIWLLGVATVRLAWRCVAYIHSPSRVLVPSSERGRGDKGRGAHSEQPCDVIPPLTTINTNIIINNR